MVAAPAVTCAVQAPVVELRAAMPAASCMTINVHAMDVAIQAALSPFRVETHDGHRDGE